MGVPGTSPVVLQRSPSFQQGSLSTPPDGETLIVQLQAALLGQTREAILNTSSLLYYIVA